MPRCRDLSLLAALLLVPAAAAWGQSGDEKPLFGPVSPTPAEKKQEPTRPRPRSGEAVDPFAALSERLTAWPGPDGVAAARELAARGAEAVPRLLANLDDNDWRIRCASAWALGELREPTAFPRLKEALRDVANRISMAPFFDALVKIDPVAATSEILPFLTSHYPRTAKQAFESLPPVIDASFEPRLRELVESRDDDVRYRAVSLLPRLASEVATSVWTGLLGDRTARIARLAAETLSRTDDKRVLDALESLALDGALRPASYALLSLTMAEDRTNRVVLEGEALVDRMFVLLRVRGELENAAAAIAMANVSMRSEEERVRTLADRQLVPILVDKAVGGRLFPDYLSVRDLCLRKAEMLSGKSFGEDGDRWRRWWIDNAEGFRARRELRAVSDDDLARLRLRYVRRRQDSSGWRVAIRGGAPEPGEEATAARLWVTLEELRRVRDVLGDIGFFARRGMKHDPSWSGDYAEAVVTIGTAEFRRAHYGDIPAEFDRLERALVELADSNVWQHFYRAEEGESRADWLARTRARFAALDAGARDLELAGMALEAFPRLHPQSRRAALEVWRRVDGAWRQEQRLGLAALVETKTMLPSTRADLMGLLGTVEGVDVKDAVVERLRLFDEDHLATCGRFFAARPDGEILDLLRSPRPEVRAAVLPVAAQRIDRGPVREAALSLTVDASPRVRTAFVEAFRGERSAAVLPDLLRRAAEAPPRRAAELAELCGAVGRGAAVAGLRDLYRQGGDVVRDGAIRGLRAADVPAAADALGEIVRTDDRRRLAALGALEVMTDPRVKDVMRALLAGEERPDRLMEYMTSAVEVFRGSLHTELGGFLGHRDAAVRRRTALLLASRRVGASVPVLIEMLLDRSWSAPARERLEQITCHVVDRVTPEAVHEGYQAWWEKNQGRGPLEWFMDALARHGFAETDLAAYARGDRRSLRAISLLLSVLKSDVWYLRTAAHAVLSEMRGEPLGTLTRRSTPADIQHVVTRWSEWYRGVQEGM